MQYPNEVLSIGECENASAKKGGVLKVAALYCTAEMGFTDREPFSDVSGVEPSVSVDSFGSLLRVLQVALEHVGTLDAHLPRKTSKRIIT